MQTQVALVWLATLKSELVTAALAHLPSLVLSWCVAGAWWVHGFIWRLRGARGARHQSVARPGATQPRTRGAADPCGATRRHMRWCHTDVVCANCEANVACALAWLCRRPAGPAASAPSNVDLCCWALHDLCCWACRDACARGCSPCMRHLVLPPTSCSLGTKALLQH